MPTYLYRDENMRLVEVVMTIADMLSREKEGKLEHEGQTLTRDMVAEHSGVEVVRAGAWPMRSDAAGVHPDQAGEAYQHSESIGVPTQFDQRTGQAIFTDRTHRKRYLAARGFIDRNAGYGD